MVTVWGKKTGELWAARGDCLEHEHRVGGGLERGKLLKCTVLTAGLGELGCPACSVQERSSGTTRWRDRSGDHGSEVPPRKSSTSHKLLCQGWVTRSWCFLPTEKDKNLIFEEPLSKAASAHQAFLLLEWLRGGKSHLCFCTPNFTVHCMRLHRK